ncbi:MAG TPA: phosphatase PAP2 family protein [Gaiellaceae bacterium]|nr:phosphatase PAP2 family protein [Gaiellaceae bacterium]
MDWRLYKAIYDVSLHHHWVGRLFYDIEKISIPLVVVMTAALWFFSRPGGDRKWKLASGSGFAAAALAYAVAFTIHHIWSRPRPYMSHHISHPWSNTTDASFPSDHTTVSFAIAAAVLAIDLPAGVIFLVVAAIISIGRIFIGAHYPSDVLAGFVIGLVVAGVVVRFLPRFVSWVVSYVERVSDPLLRPLWRSTGR